MFPEKAEVVLTRRANEASAEMPDISENEEFRENAGALASFRVALLCPPFKPNTQWLRFYSIGEMGKQRTNRHAAEDRDHNL